MGICLVENCTRNARSRGLCGGHYRRWQKGLDLAPAIGEWLPYQLSKATVPPPPRPKPQTFEERFWAKVDVRGPDECWEWKGARRPDGYGLIGRNGKQLRAHRVALELAGHTPRTGPRWVVMHLCDNRCCVNPAHLLDAKQCDNMDDMTRKGRRIQGPKPRGDEHWLRRPYAGMTDEERFWAQVRQTEDHWIWTAGLVTGGKPAWRFRLGEFQQPAHRIAYELTLGVSLVGRKLTRDCDEPLCVRPDHCHLGGPRGVHDTRGEKNPAAKLRPVDVARIRDLMMDAPFGRQAALAREYGVSGPTIARIVKRRGWT